jgi:hypothetical protein
MNDSFYKVDITKIPGYRVLTEEDLKAEEDELDEYDMKRSIMIKGKIIKKYGELRPYIKSTAVARKFENFLHEDDFIYFYEWILDKEISEKLKNSNS